MREAIYEWSFGFVRCVTIAVCCGISLINIRTYGRGKRFHNIILKLLFNEIMKYQIKIKNKMK